MTENSLMNEPKPDRKKDDDSAAIDEGRELYDKLKEGLEDIKAGREHPLSEVAESLRQRRNAR